MENMKKIIAVMVATIMLAVATPTVFGATTVTGTFTPSSSGVSIACNRTSPAFGSIALNSEGSIENIYVNNTGDTNCSVTMTAEDGSGTWSLVAGTDSPATSNEYCVNMKVEDGAFQDVQTQKTVSSDIPPSGAGTNYTYVALKVHVSKYTSEGTPGEQTFFTNLTASAIS